MAKKLNQTKWANAILKKFKVESYGKIYAQQYGADGFSILEVEIQPLPNTIVDFLIGDNRTVFALSKNVTKLGHNILGTYPSIEIVYLYHNGVVELEDDTFALLDNLTNIYVPADYVDEYKSTYPALANLFSGIVAGVVWTIPFVEGETALTKEMLDGFISMIEPETDKSITEKIIVPSDYENFEFGYDETIFQGQEFTALEEIEYESGEKLLDISFDTSLVGSILEVE